MTCDAPNRFIVRADGGYSLFSSAVTGVYLGPGSGAWAAYSDRNAKSHIQAVDPRDVLDRVVAMPVSTWQWSSEPGSISHMGPMAQDFHAAFGLGDSDKRIVTVDADGVALAAIQGLNHKLEARLADQAREIAELRRTVEMLLARVPTNERIAVVR